MASKKSVTEKIKDRRRTPRVKDNIFVFFQSMGNDMVSEAITEDISGGGLMFKTSNRILEKTELMLEICQPLNYNKNIFLTILVEARVVWHREELGNSEYLVGVKITKMDDESQKRICRYLNERLKLK